MVSAGVGIAARLRFFARILLPLSRPALVTVAILAFVMSWNNYPLAYIVFTTPSHFTLPLGVATFQTQYSPDTARIFAFPRCRWCPHSVSSSLPNGASWPVSPAR